MPYQSHSPQLSDIRVKVEAHTPGAFPHTVSVPRPLQLSFFSCYPTPMQNSTANPLLHLLSELWGLRTGHLALLGLLLHPGLDLSLLLRNKLFLMKDVHIYLGLGRGHPKPPVCLSWRERSCTFSITFAPQQAPVAADGSCPCDLQAWISDFLAISDQASSQVSISKGSHKHLLQAGDKSSYRSTNLLAKN